jgi:hypothetical protein
MQVRRKPNLINCKNLLKANEQKLKDEFNVLLQNNVNEQVDNMNLASNFFNQVHNK